jgi:hypothetical protein
LSRQWLIPTWTEIAALHFIKYCSLTKKKLFDTFALCLQSYDDFELSTVDDWVIKQPAVAFKTLSNSFLERTEKNQK